MTHSRREIPLPGYPGYRVDSNGTIWSVTEWRGYPLRALIPNIDHDGYARVRLMVDGRRRRFGVHVLVCTAFHGAKPPGAQVRHLDGNSWNNSETNLAWGTGIENAADRDRHGTTYRGVRHHSARLTPASVAEIRRSTDAGVSLAAIYGVTPTTITKIRTGKIWKTT